MHQNITLSVIFKPSRTQDYSTIALKVLDVEEEETLFACLVGQRRHGLTHASAEGDVAEADRILNPSLKFEPRGSVFVIE